MRTSILLSLCLVACGGAQPPAPSVRSDAETEWNAWRAARREALAGEDGWLALIALAWLEPGERTIGSDPGSDVVLPADRAPARVARFLVADDVRFVAEPGVDVSVNGAPVTELLLASDRDGEPTQLASGSLRMHVIDRAGRLGLRVRDRASPAREAFAEIPTFDYDPRFRVRARVVQPDPPRMLGIVNVLGMQVDEPCAGVVQLELDGHPFALAATSDGEGGLFVMLRDATASEGETYGAGRYLDVAAPDASGETWVDFNYLYTPPCGYTSFATCPLPPAENVVDFPIRAGERYDPH